MCVCVVVEYGTVRFAIIFIYIINLVIVTTNCFYYYYCCHCLHSKHLFKNVLEEIMIIVTIIIIIIKGQSG